MTTGKKVALITGCSSGGLGAALAISLHKANYRVIATARNTSKLEETRAVGIEDLELDVLSPTSITRCLRDLEVLTAGRLDLLINNAGAGYNMPVVDVDIEEARKVFDLNVFSLITVTRAFLPLLLKSKDAKVVNNISIAAYVGLPITGTYSSSKAAANMMTETLRVELAPFGVRVIALMTGSVKSNFTHNLPSSNAEVPHELPEDSIYRVVPGGLKMMTDPEPLIMKDAMDAHVWAEQVVGDLSRANSPHQIWRGAHVTVARAGCHFPIGLFDRQLKQTARLDELDAALKRC